MNKIQIVYFGKNVLVDEDQVNLLKRKEMLVAEAKVSPSVEVSSKIIRLNRRIRKNVIFI